MSSEREKVQGHLNIEWDCPQCGTVNTLEAPYAQSVACSGCDAVTDVHPANEQLDEAFSVLRAVRPEIDSMIAGLQRSHENPATGVVDDEDVAHELSELQTLHERIERVLSATAPPDSEPVQMEEKQSPAGTTYYQATMPYPDSEPALPPEGMHKRLYMDIVYAFQERAYEFLPEDGEGGFVAAVHRMADEIERLRSGSEHAEEAAADPMDVPSRPDPPQLRDALQRDLNRLWAAAGGPVRRRHEYTRLSLALSELTDKKVCSGCGAEGPHAGWIMYPCGEWACSEDCWREAHPEAPISEALRLSAPAVPDAVRRLPEHMEKVRDAHPHTDAWILGATTMIRVVTGTLAQHVEQWRVPEGWKLVPVEPTEEMCAAGEKAARWSEETGHSDGFVAAAVYTSMLAAAPQPTETQHENQGRVPDEMLNVELPVRVQVGDNMLIAEGVQLRTLLLALARRGMPGLMDEIERTIRNEHSDARLR